MRKAAGRPYSPEIGDPGAGRVGSRRGLVLASSSAPPYKRYREIGSGFRLRMIVVCPVCKIRYLVDPRALGATGRMVRCAQCSHTWHHKPSAELLTELETVAPPPAEPPVAIRPAAPGAAVEAPALEGELGEGRIQLPALSSRRPRSLVPIGWLLLVLVVALVAGVGVWERDAVIRLWPPSARLYALVGLASPQPSDVLKLSAVPRRDEENGVPRLVIEGEVANISQDAQPVPKLKVELRDVNGRPVQSWVFAVSTDRLLPGASVPFTTSVARPSEAATGMSVTFAAEGE